MIDNISLVLVSEVHFLDIWVNNSMKRVCQLLELFWKLSLVLKILALNTVDKVRVDAVY